MPSRYILILQNFFYVLRAVKVHHQEVSCRIQTLCSNVKSNHIC